ncbi:tellurium resistance protein TerW [Superficieibacter sp. HKU1]|uniref:tellurium resistance protein TerW n=1 Tax=Superficieibacter sp. HKU1 TaxID=3031919 RepID=UPI0023E1BA4E|nr:tellurium resistance protein TerW [Superficieibacter sp. HKU1]WES70465.1 tellurium resistance protein TerW [Superficieibacter sp. HKU1]
MLLSSRQERVFKLATILGTGKQVSASYILELLECSEPTLTRALKELRESYAADIKYSKAVHAYQIMNFGSLDKKALRRMTESLNANAELKKVDATRWVDLDKDKKTAVSLSLRMSILRKIDRYAFANDKTRSEAVELLTEKAFELLQNERVNTRK